MIELPRNFQFIQRLPEHFEMTVLSEGNITGQTQWYEVIIASHHLNILSRINLVAGKTYTIKKKSPLKLEVLGEAPRQNPFTGVRLESIEPDQPLPGPKPDAAIKVLSALPGKEARAYQVQNGFLFEVLFDDEAILYLFFKPEQEGWALFCATAPEDSSKKELLRPQLLEPAGVCQYTPTSPEHIKILVTGFQGTG